MKNELKVKSSKFRVKISKLMIFMTALIFSTFNFQLSTCYAKVYIDITSPAIKKLPIAIQEFNGTEGGTIANTIRDDLDFTGFFSCIDRAAYIETPSQPFDQDNWAPIGAEAVVKGTLSSGQELIVAISLYDVFEGREIFKREYKTGKNSVRKLAHTIANDIYRQLTGEDGIFRTKIAFVAEDEGKKGLYIMDWDGKDIKRLGIKGDFVLTPHWSRAGDKLLYSSERGGQWGIYLLDFTRMTERKIFFSTGLNMTGNFSPEGDEVIFSSSQDESYGLYSLKLSSSKVKRITATRFIEISPAISPDGKLVAFVSDKGGTPQIYVMSREGYDIRRLTFEGSYNTSPGWSPDGEKIAFVGRNSGKHQIFTINADGSGLMQLTGIGNNEDPSFSPDGRFIIFASDRDNTNGIYVMKATGESQKRISPTWLRAIGPKWSPN